MSGKSTNLVLLRYFIVIKINNEYRGRCLFEWVYGEFFNGMLRQEQAKYSHIHTNIVMLDNLPFRSEIGSFPLKRLSERIQLQNNHIECQFFLV